MKDIPGYEGIYAITTDGQVWSYKKNRWLAQTIDKGYHYVHLITDKDRRYSVHRLVALTYIDNPDPENKVSVDHINRNRGDNRVENLRWASWQEQVLNREPGASDSGQKAASEARKKCVEMRDKNDHSILIKTFESSCEASRYLFNGDTSKNSLINRCANGDKLSAYGYWWCFREK